MLPQHFLRAARRAVSSAAGAAGAAASGAAATRHGMTPEQMERKYLLGNYSADGVRLKPGLAFVRGEGSRLIGNDGRSYVDWAAGIAVNAIGHSDSEWAAVVADQAHKLAHISNLYHSWEPLELAKMMVESSAGGHLSKVFFCNSGTEANEAALKFARKAALVRAYARKAACQAAATGSTATPAAPAAFTPGCKKNPPSKCATSGGMCACWPQATDEDIRASMATEVVAFKNSFHGRTMGALAATHKPAIRQPFGPFPGDVKFAYFNDLPSVEAVVSPKTAAIIVEPVQGEGGIYAAKPDFMAGLRRLADSVGALLIADEVQCGLGRTGRLWAHEAYPDARPDIMTLAKPLAGGLPIGAVMMTEAVAGVIKPGDHGTTYGGNPFVTRAAQVVFQRIADPAFLAASRARGAHMLSGLRTLATRFPSIISEVRSAPDGGLFAGVQLTIEPKPIVEAAAARGLLIITAGEKTLRICPPLNISAEDVELGLSALGEALEEVAAKTKAA